MMPQNRFAWFAWGVLGYNLLVILWGAFVRATGSGAGCGAHWPLCNGQVIPRAPEVETLIELTHRATSGVALLLVAGMLVWAFRAYPKGATVRRGAAWSMVFIITEALVGAGLVLFGWVGADQSAYRAISIAVHLVNTFLLLAALALTAWWASGGAPLRLRGAGAAGWALGAALLGLLLLGATGAITALGDTLFPAGSLIEGMQQDLSPTAHFLIRLRVVHPILAMVLGLYVVALAWRLTRQAGRATERLAWTLTGIYLAQLLVGGVNLGLLAPVPLQLIHLLLADLTWIALVLLAAAALADPLVVDARRRAVRGARQPV